MKNRKDRFRPKLAIRKGDQVVVIAGNDKDLSTPHRVLAVYPFKSKALVEGVNLVTKHVKPNAQSPQGGIIKVEAPIHISNIQLWDAKAKAHTRIRRERSEGKVVRISKKTGQEI